jgi:hypothetical protein
MLNFYPEEVAKTLHQFAEMADRHGNVQVTKECLCDLAKKLTGGLPRPGPTDYGLIDRYPMLEPIIVTRWNGSRDIFWLKPKTIDYSVWMNLYDRGWRDARFPCPSLVEDQMRRHP